jgi:hypothetical protein
LELAGAGEAAPVERRAPALLERGALEAFAHRVVVRGSGRGPVVADVLGGDRRGEGPGDVLGAVEFLTVVKGWWACSCCGWDERCLGALGSRHSTNIRLARS